MKDKQKDVALEEMTLATAKEAEELKKKQKLWINKSSSVSSVVRLLFYHRLLP